jgi:hypothetical protein
MNYFFFISYKDCVWEQGVGRTFGCKTGSNNSMAKVHSEELHSLWSSQNITWAIKSRRIRWARYVARIEMIGNSHGIFVGEPEGKDSVVTASKIVCHDIPEGLRTTPGQNSWSPAKVPYYEADTQPLLTTVLYPVRLYLRTTVDMASLNNPRNVHYEPRCPHRDALVQRPQVQCASVHNEVTEQSYLPSCQIT